MFWHRFKRIAADACVALLVLLALLFGGARILGLRPYVVLSGSMAPAYPTGALVYVKAAAPETIQVGQALTFVMDESLRVATHRVIEVDAAGRSFRTQGDANARPDGAPVRFENVLGVPVFCIPRLGYLVQAMFQGPGLYLTLAVAAALLALLFWPNGGAPVRKKTAVLAKGESDPAHP